MVDASLLELVKAGLGITGDFHDNLLSIYIDEVKEFMADAGVSEDVLESDASSGCVLRGVSDLWNFGGSKGELSKYFQMRLIQLKNKEE